MALIEADRLGQLRTAAATGVAVEWMAEMSATEVGLFGSGHQAETQLEAVAQVRQLKSAFVYSRNPARRADFAARMSARIGCQVIPVDRPQEAAEDLPIVITATTASEPVFNGNDLAEGTLVCAVGIAALHRRGQGVAQHPGCDRIGDHALEAVADLDARLAVLGEQEQDEAVVLSLLPGPPGGRPL